MRININNTEVEETLIALANMYGKSPTAIVYKLIREQQLQLAQFKDAKVYDKTTTERTTNS